MSGAVDARQDGARSATGRADAKRCNGLWGGTCDEYDQTAEAVLNVLPAPRCVLPEAHA